MYAVYVVSDANYWSQFAIMSEADALVAVEAGDGTIVAEYIGR